MASHHQERDRLVVPEVMLLVSSHLAQRDLSALLGVNKYCRGALLTHASLWKVLSFQGETNAGDRLLAALSLARYEYVEQINLEFAQGVWDEHLEALKCNKLEHLNLNACQKISDAGVKAVVFQCPSIRKISLYWNLKVTDDAVKSIVTNLKHLELLNISGCKNVTDQGMKYISEYCPSIRSLNLTRCVRLTDEGLSVILNSCWQLEELYLYALSGFTPKSLKLIGDLQELRLVELTGAQELTVSVQLYKTRVAELELVCEDHRCSLSCPLKLLSLHGILGVTDESLNHLSSFCLKTLNTLDVNGCINIKKRSRKELRHLFPGLTCFQVHS